jgi:hypothetical protein
MWPDAWLTLLGDCKDAMCLSYEHVLQLQSLQGMLVHYVVVSASMYAGCCVMSMNVGG